MSKTISKKNECAYRWLLSADNGVLATWPDFRGSLIPIFCLWTYMPCHLQKNKGMMPVGSQSTEEVDQNYVPMSANSPSHHHSGSLTEPMHEPNYVPMTPSTMEFSSLGKQVPPPAHMGFRSSPKTPPRRPMLSDCQPPPVDRNLKPDRKGERTMGVHACVAVTMVHKYFVGLSRSCCRVDVCWNLLLHLTSSSMLGIH